MQPALLLFFQLLLVVVTASAVLLAFRRLSQLQNERVTSFKVAPIFLETKWRETLAEAVPIYNRLPQRLQFQLETRTLEFLRSKPIVPAGGLDAVSPSVKISVAGTACLLIAGNNERCFPRISKIHIYPTTAANNPNAAGFAERRTDGIHIHLGRSWIFYGSSIASDAFNVVIHEFAHYLDFDTFIFPGIPRLRHWHHYPLWVRTIASELREIRAGYDSALATQLRLHPQGIDSVELFAHAAEFFFERPQVLLDEHSALYGLLREYFEQDPVLYQGR